MLFRLYLRKILLFTLVTRLPGLALLKKFLGPLFRLLRWSLSEESLASRVLFVMAIGRSRLAILFNSCNQFSMLLADWFAFFFVVSSGRVHHFLLLIPAKCRGGFLLLALWHKSKKGKLEIALFAWSFLVVLARYRLGALYLVLPCCLIIFGRGFFLVMPIFACSNRFISPTFCRHLALLKWHWLYLSDAWKYLARWMHLV